uniref:R2D2 n=1 Tax=Bemisia tabaci TaxID=7038 RepID=A0A067ZUY0_BEMTA|nr:R2D2 [Bemisia tabaci]
MVEGDQTIDAAKSPQNPKGSRNKEAVSKKLMRDGEVTTMNDTNPEAPMEVDETANKIDGNKTGPKRFTRHKKEKPQEPLNLEEAAKKELMIHPSKTPVSILQEVLPRRGTQPKYELVQIEGAIHEPTFRYRVTVGNIVSMGTGRSKKEAKHVAARTLLEKLVGNTEGLIKTPIPTPMPGDARNPDLNPNPIGQLQELCMARRWPPPTYTTETEEGLPHERLFTVVCTIFKQKETGVGKSKKLAKREAASKMWHKMKDLPMETSELPSGLDDDDELIQRLSRLVTEFDEIKNSKVKTLNSEYSHKISKFHRNLKLSSGEKLVQLQDTSLVKSNLDFFAFLQEIAVEQKFEVTYVDIEEKSISGKYQCLVQLATLPVAVCHGTGLTSKAAQIAAARNALEYLKIMTKG